MRNIVKQIIFTVFTLTAIACTEKQSLDIPENYTENGVTLNLFSSTAKTRAMSGVESLGENSIKSLHYFFYPMNPDDPTADPLAQEPEFWGYIPNIDAQDEYVLRINFTEFMLNYKVFPRPYNTCQVYIIANLPEDKITDGTNKDLASLRAISLQGDFTSSTEQDTFIMEGLGTAEIINRKNIISASGTIHLDRVAAKISLGVSVVDEYTPQTGTIGVGKTWYPDIEAMTVELVNGVSRTVLGATPVECETSDYFRTDARSFTKNSENVWEAEPFYTYPASWDIGADNEPYLRIMLPWKTIINTEVDGQEPPIESYQNCYYKIILGGTEITRNTWYDLKAQIGVFGSFDEQEEIILDVTNTTYYVADWTTGLNIESNILGGRYLVVDKLTYEVYNQDYFEIPVSSSHPCSIDVTKHSKVDLMTDGGEKEDSDYSIRLSDDGKHIIFENGLDNNMESKTFDFTPYTFTFTIKHSDNATYSKEITIIQYPAVYAVAENNTDYENGGNANADNGFVWVNGYQEGSANNGDDFFGSAPGRSNTAADPHMYVFTVTSTTGTNFIIGDPRENTVTYNENSARWHQSPAIYDNANRELKYYYGTKVASDKYTNADNNTGKIYANDAEAEAAEPTLNMIAPKFRLASGYAVLSTNDNEVQTLENLKKRCASYQEDGYPAGRWRLPTRAEFQFIMTQIALQNLPTVYISGTTYWCAHGLGTPTNAGIVEMNYVGYDNNGHSVRCVYDEWYWENSESYRLGTKNANGTFTPTDTFTWGDMPRTEFK